MKFINFITADVDLYVDEARHLFDDFKCHRGWVKGVLNSKTQALNAEARALGYTQGPIQGDILYVYHYLRVNFFAI
jgi:hypothetical protein